MLPFGGRCAPFCGTCFSSRCGHHGHKWGVLLHTHPPLKSRRSLSFYQRIKCGTGEPNSSSSQAEVASKADSLKRLQRRSVDIIDNHRGRFFTVSRSSIQTNQSRRRKSKNLHHEQGFLEHSKQNPFCRATTDPHCGTSFVKTVPAQRRKRRAWKANGEDVTEHEPTCQLST